MRPVVNLTLALAVLGALGAAAVVGTIRTALPENAYAGMRWRLLGPHRGGWATMAQGAPDDPASFYFGAAAGGLWKSPDAGATWKPIFAGQGSASIGAFAVAASDPRVIWVGTGQIHARYDVVSGDGVYRSTDGGATWKAAGLEATRHIGRVWVDPRDAKVAVVAALGHLFQPNPERGLYRTADGGATWTHVLDRGPDVGAADVAQDPSNPDRLFASLWQVRRHPWLDYFQPPVGPGSGIVRSIDGGKHWTPVGTKGLPAGGVGRISLAAAKTAGGLRVYAGIDAAARAGGIFRSDDGGDSWTRVNADTALAGSYMNSLSIDPTDPDVVWAAGRGLRRSKDGGRTFVVMKGAPGGDDYHQLWIDPKNPRRMIVAADQGAVVTLNGGDTWSSWYNQPTGQFYRLAADDQEPYRIYSGQQDSGTVSIASRSDYGQITLREWAPVGGDERDGVFPDPDDPSIAYGAGLGGRLSRFDERDGQVQNVSPWPISTYGERPTEVLNRYGWITPTAVSKRPPHAIYQGAQVLFRSDDHGQSWKTISPDLTGAVAGAKECDGEVPVERATACGFGVIWTIAPSPAADGVIWIGTDNGRVQLTRDAGRSWSDVTPPGLTDWTRVNTIDPSPSDPAVAYVAGDRHRHDDLAPYAWRTTDYGATWTMIAGGLPAGAWVGVLRQDPERAGLLYAGTSRGVQVSFDDGATWQTLQRNLPSVEINDLLVQRGDLVAATQGRAIWVLDDLEPLRQAGSAAPDEAPRLLNPRAALRLRANMNRDTPLPPDEPHGENPPVGAVIDYLLPQSGAKEVTIEVHAADGALVNRFVSTATPARPTETIYFDDVWLAPAPRPTTHPGHNRFIWDLKYPMPQVIEPEYSMSAVPGQPTPLQPSGAFVLPGKYEVRLVVGGVTRTATLVVGLDPRARVAPGALEALLLFQREVEEALARSATQEAAETAAKARLDGAKADLRAAAEKSRIEKALIELENARGPENARPVAVNRQLAAIAADLESADAAPTEPQRQAVTSLKETLAKRQEAWSRFASGTLAAIDRRLQALGIK
ncbi:MAG TPA: hypothetical protein VMQ62_10675 [Dongiaceae bacterium]|nr:hypothetical protein [Dongiaceae bacterium]